MVELMMPPMRTMASGEYSGLYSMISGTRPPMAAREVRRIVNEKLHFAGRPSCGRLPFSTGGCTLTQMKQRVWRPHLLIGRR